MGRIHRTAKEAASQGGRGAQETEGATGKCFLKKRNIVKMCAECSKLKSYFIFDSPPNQQIKRKAQRADQEKQMLELKRRQEEQKLREIVSVSLAN